MISRTNRAFGLMLALCAYLPVASAISAGQVDDFESGTTENWSAGGGPVGQTPPTPPANVATGGPNGIDDNYLLVTSSGNFGPGGKPTTSNFLGNWSGDYLAAGVGTIVMDVNNLGATDLDLRLGFGSGVVDFGPPFTFTQTDLAITSNAVSVAAGSGWQTISFDVSLGALTAALGSVNNALSNTVFLRIFHNETANFPGPAVPASLGIDNISAVPVPPAIVFLLSGFAGLIARSRVKR